MALEFCVDLQLYDFLGEEITDNSVWIKKSHDPKWNEGNKIHKCNKVIVCVRNPFDTIVSFMNFLPSLNHSAPINEDFQKDIPDIWYPFVQQCTDSLRIFHD